MTVAIEHAPHRLTWESFTELPEEQLHNAELHDGVVVYTASPERHHQLTLVNLIGELLPWVRSHGGEMIPDAFVHVADFWGYQPDLAYYEAARVPEGRADYRDAPNLAVEILSPSTRRKDLMRKPAHYFAAGVQELWLIDVEERLVMVMRPGPQYAEWGEGDVMESPVLPGFAVEVSQVLAPFS
jgi:Uma2 family endonuclease